MSVRAALKVQCEGIDGIQLLLKMRKIKIDLNGSF